ncbi:MAG: S8 family serine peptidase [Anaerohalosphaeraceae bacterium]|nr:S8 family serine peptidase [Anaerohalosphaeraceae bacterium]
MFYKTNRKIRDGFYARGVSVLVLVFCAAVAAGSVEPGSLNFAGVYGIAESYPEITGRGVSIGAVCRSVTYSDNLPQNDFHADTSHKCMADVRGKVDFYQPVLPVPQISQHSTAIASILIGYDPNAFFAPIGNFEYEGACPDADLDIYEFWHFVSEYVFAGQRPQSDVLTMSFGSAFEDWWTRGIDRMAEHYGILIVAAVGNGRGDYNLPLYPASGDNIMAVGVVDSDKTNGIEGALTNFTTVDPNNSTQGPTSDGRCKPDIVAPGNCLVAVAGSEKGYALSGDYSSYAAPVVAGVASLLIQEVKDDPNLVFATLPTVGNAVLKSILMTAAKKLPGWHKGFSSAADDSEYPLDLKQGAGVVDGLTSLELLKSGMQRTGDVNTNGWDVNFLEPDYAAEKVYRFKLDSAKSARLTATLVWNRIYQDSYPFNAAEDAYSDLQLELWAIDSHGNRTASLIQRSNSPVDNVEHLYADITVEGDYELVIANSEKAGLPDSATAFAISWRLEKQVSSN